ncbi:MAG: hypothetical protein ACOC7P_03730, partial [Chloroflexota bacterium]
TDLRRSLRRLCHEIYQQCDFESLTQARLSQVSDDSEEAREKRRAIEEEFYIPQEPQELVRKFHDFLKLASASHRVVLVIDALNQMDAADNAHAMYWLPYQFPPIVRIIVSTLEHPALDVLRRRGKEVKEKTLEPLSENDSLAIVQGSLSRCHKEMTDKQVQALLAKKDRGNPLYLLATLEELRTLGTYEEITERIKELPEVVPELFIWIFQRLEKDPGFRDAQGNHIGPELVRGFASLMAVSRYGLSQMELQELLAPGDSRSDPSVPPDHQGNVAALLRLLRPYLMHRGDLLDFFHGQAREAAEGKYLEKEGERLATHARLVEYFKTKVDPEGNLTWTGDYMRGLAELPYHQAQAHTWAGFRETLTSFAFIKTKLKALGIYILIDDYALASLFPWQEIAANTIEEAEVLRLIKGALQLSAGVVGRDPRQLAGQITGRMLSLELPDIESFLQSIRKDQFGPWLRPINPCLIAPGGPLLAEFIGHAESIRSWAVTSDSKKAISASWDGKLKVWNLENGKELYTISDQNFEALAVTADAQKFISSALDNTLKVRCIVNGQELHSLVGHTDSVEAVVVTQDGRHIISASRDNTLRVWDLMTGQELHTLSGFDRSRFIPKLAVTQDGQMIISTCYNDKITLKQNPDTVMQEFLEKQHRDILGV